jgi:hypothetical protein
LTSAEEAAEWVRQSLPEKSRLRASDGAQVEAVFEAKLAQLTVFSTAAVQAQKANTVEPAAPPIREADLPSDVSKGSLHQKAVDKSALGLPEPRRVRDRDHSGQSQDIPAWCAVDFHRILIICVLRKAAHYRAKSVMGLLSRYAAVTTASSISAATKPVGGVALGSMC